MKAGIRSVPPDSQSHSWGIVRGKLGDRGNDNGVDIHELRELLKALTTVGQPVM